MELDMNKKILLLGLILLIIAGIVVIALKGLNVSLMYKQHESINLFIGQEIDLNEFKSLCKEVFGNKNVVLRRIELFGDSININVDTVTDEEKEALVNKINEKFNEEYTVDNITVSKIPNIRIRDLLAQYIRPIAISGALIIAYMLIRFRKIKPIKLIGKIILIIALTEVTLLSVIAITRIPVSAMIINLMFVIGILELLVYNYKTEKNV